MLKTNKYKYINPIIFIITFSLAVYGVVFSGYSQDLKLKIKNKKLMKLGAKAGLNFTDLYKTSPLNDPFKKNNTSGNNPYLGVDFGGMLGILVYYNVGNRFNIQLEIQYTKKGGSFNKHGYMNKVSLRYIDTHLNLGMRFFDVFVIRSGAVVGYLVSTKSIFNNTTFSNDKEPFNPVSLGAMFSVGYLNWDGFFADLRTEIDFSNVNNTNYPERDFFLGNIVYQISAGFFIPL